MISRLEREIERERERKRKRERERERLRVFENKVLRTTFGAKSDEITGERRKLHNA